MERSDIIRVYKCINMSEKEKEDIFNCCTKGKIKIKNISSVRRYYAYSAAIIAVIFLGIGVFFYEGTGITESDIGDEIFSGSDSAIITEPDIIFFESGCTETCLTDKSQEEAMREMRELEERKRKEAEMRRREEEMKLQGTEIPELIWPCPDTFGITDNFGYSDNGVLFGGIGIGEDGCYGRDIVAAASGIVTEAGDSGNGLGIKVVIDHGNGCQTVYAHMSEMLVSKGDEVSQGDVIGKIGSSGYTEKVMCFFQIRICGIALDPLDFVKK